VNRFVDLLRSRVPHAAALALGLTAVDFLRNLPLITETRGAPYVGAAAECFVNWFLMSLVSVAIISACDAWMKPGAVRALVKGAALTVGIVAYVYWIGTSAWLTVQFRGIGMDDDAGLSLYLTWMGWTMSVLLSAFYRAHAKATAASTALRRAELERERAQKRLLDSRLSVLEAQVEPQSLFEALSRVHKLYSEDAVRADQALDDLIAHLRGKSHRAVTN
jgi:hypothetical protein